MRRIVRLMIITLLLLGSALALGGPAISAPAQQYSYGPECVDFTGGYEVCFSGEGVLQEIGSASGNALYRASGTSSYQDFFDGILYGESSGRFNEVLVAKEGEDQVYHYNSKQQFTYSDETCTYQESFTYANGEVRHNAYDFQCTPTP